MGPRVGTARLRRCWRARHGPGRCQPAIVLHSAASAQRYRHAAHGARVQPDHHGQPHALPPHVGAQHRLGAGHRPRRHCHTNRRRAPAARARREPPRPGPPRFREKSVGVEGKIGQHHHHANAPPGRQRGLEPRILHHGRQALQGRHRHLCEAVPAGPDLPRQAPGELGPGAAISRVRPGSGKRGERRLAVAHRLPAGRWLGPAGGGHHAA